MPAETLNHYTIRPKDLEATKNFYCEVVGLTVGDRPPLGFPGYWLYCGGIPTVHLLGERAGDQPIKSDATGHLDHIAFTASGLNDMRERLRSRKLAFRENLLPRINAMQLFFLDPDGVAVELNFPPGEK